MITQQFINNFKSTLTADLSSGSTTASIAPGDAALLSGASEEKPYVATLEVGTTREVVHVIGANGTTGELTMLRAQEGTSSPATWASGTKLECRLTKGMLDRLQRRAKTFIDRGDQSFGITIDPAQGSLQRIRMADNITLSLPSSGVGYEDFEILLQADTTHNLSAINVGGYSAPNYIGSYSFPISVPGGTSKLVRCIRSSAGIWYVQIN